MSNPFSNKFLYLLLTLLVLIVVHPLVSATAFGRGVVLLSYLLVLAAVVFSMLETRNRWWLAVAFAVLLMCSQLAAWLNPQWILTVLATLVAVVFYIFIIALISVEAFKSSVITQNTVYSALSIYLLLGLFFGEVYQLLTLWQPRAWVFTLTGWQHRVVSAFDLTYFSFTTLTTVGFGDIVPVTKPAKAMVILEQVSGVLYVAALISRLVSGMSWVSKSATSNGAQ